MGWMEDLAEACDDDDEPTSCLEASQDTDCWASAESSLAQPLQSHEATEPDTFRLLEGFAETWPHCHERDAYLAAQLYADLSAWWSAAPQLAMAFLLKRPGEPWSSDYRRSAEGTLHSALKVIASTRGEAKLPLHLLEAANLCDRRILPKTDALWCVIVGSSGTKHHSFLAAFSAEQGTVRIENSRGAGFVSVANAFDAGSRPETGGFSFADWHGNKNAYGGYEAARYAYGRGQWLTAAEWQDTFLHSLTLALDAMGNCDTEAACDVAEACFGFREMCGVWSSMFYPHIVIIEVCRKAAESKPLLPTTHRLNPVTAKAATVPTVAELLDHRVPAWLKRRPSRCHQAAELHRRLAAEWPNSAWRALAFLKGNEWEDAYVESVQKICSARVMGKGKPIPPASVLPTSALCEATAPPECDALYCVSIGFLESGFVFAKQPHPRHFHTFMLYYDAARRCIRTENAWENRYTFAAWRDESKELAPEYRSARLRFGGGRWLPHTLWQQNFWNQLISAVESADFLGARDHFEHCFGVRPDVELQGYSQYPYVLIEEVRRKELP